MQTITALSNSGVYIIGQKLSKQVFNVIHTSRTISAIMADQKIASMQKYVMEVPTAVRGMQDLRKEAFTTNVTLLALRVDASKLSTIQRKVRLEKYLFKNLGRIKNIMNADDSKHKLLLFDPNTLHENSVELESLKSHIESLIKEHTGEIMLQWRPITLTVAFEDWDIRSIIKAVLPSDLDFSSYSQTGHIVHVNLRENLLPYKRIIGQILLEKVSRCRTVVNKVDEIKSEYRNFELDLLAGVDDYVTETLEAGVRYRLDFSKVFWNSRLSHEHERVVKLFDRRSLVYDACAGVGPFVLPALKKGHASHALANDLNPESVRWLKENAVLNKMESMQSVLPPNMSPGWNDPPNLGTPSPGSAPSRLTHLRKRLVDPSISGGSSSPCNMMSQPGQGHPAHMYAGNTNSPVTVDNVATSQMYQNGSSAISVGLLTSAPSPAAANSQSSIANHAQPYQQNVGIHNQSAAVISPSSIPQSSPVQMHLPQQPDQGYSSSATYPYSGTVPPANQQNQGVHQFTSVSGSGPNLQNGDGNNSQFFHQQPYHEAPPIRRA
nr:Protein of unknown function Met10 domain containing protein [Haemonchus contortus]